MPRPHLDLFVVDGAYAICRLAPSEPIPPWADAGRLTAITRTADELSILCEAHLVPEGVERVDGYRAIGVEGPLPFDAIGIAAALTAPLAEAGVSVLFLSTFATDYLFVREADRARAVEALRAAGHRLGATR